MRVFLERRDRAVRASRRLQQSKEWVDSTSGIKMLYWEDLKLAEADRREQAATAVQAAYRGWEGRQIAADRRARVDASTCIQRHYRGMLGRRLATEECWRQRQVVPTAYSLKVLVQRSREAQRADGWIEYFDADTGAFWYLEEATKHSTWDAPDAFADSMTCVWDPWPTPYSSPLDKPCRKVFRHMVEFQSHRLHAHPWQCPACGQRNAAMTFPRCEVCDSGIGPEGQDLEKVVGEAVRAALRGMRNHHLQSVVSFTDNDGISEYEDDCTVETTTASSGVERSKGEDGRHGDDSKTQRDRAGGATLTQSPGGSSVENPRMGATAKLPRRKDAGAGVVGSSLRGVLEGESSVGSTVSRPTVSPGNTLRVCYQFTQGRCSLTTCPRAHPGIRDDARLERMGNKGSRGLFIVTVCPLALAATFGDGDSCPTGQMCKMYHPYVRPTTAEIVRRLYPKRNGDRVKVYPSGATHKGTVVHEIFQGYGIYSWPNGDVFMGQWVDGVRHGGGIFTSADGREFVGGWEGNVRQGYGILTHPNGESYEGQFHRGKMHGVGLLSAAGDDSFAGEFRDGKPEGIGCFRRKNGDKYNGWVRGGEAQGMGVLAYSCGEKYKGDFRADMRCGRGVCCYPNGSKFAGHWERNLHHGFGVFVAPCGRERYVGQWQHGQKHGYGRYIFANGDVYDGGFQHDQAWGQGVYRYALSGGEAGDWYMGGWEADKRHGNGILQWANGSRYDGYWKEGVVEGKGVFAYTGGDRYRGEFRQNEKHGRGVYVWANGNSYTGDFCRGVICGAGEMKYNTTGHRYKGQWLNDKKHGHGTFWYADGNVYEGDFFEDEIHGRGRLTLFPGSILEEVYDGEFAKGVKHGRGVYVYPKGDGTVYDGDWDDGLRHGHGLLRFADGSFYQGDFLRERKHGTGCMVWVDGSQYQGRWDRNHRHGEGTLLHADGTIFRGQFYRDKKHGTGTVTSLDGSCYEGEWEHDRVLGTKGRFTLLTGLAHEDKVHLKVFGY